MPPSALRFIANNRIIIPAAEDSPCPSSESCGPSSESASVAHRVTVVTRPSPIDPGAHTGAESVHQGNEKVARVNFNCPGLKIIFKVPATVLL
jgi:hypothetical protein